MSHLRQESQAYKRCSIRKGYSDNSISLLEKNKYSALQMNMRRARSAASDGSVKPIRLHTFFSSNPTARRPALAPLAFSVGWLRAHAFFTCNGDSTPLAA